jgi:Tfp pilus assembly protein FimT
MKLQRGVSLNGMMIGSVIFAVLALLTMKVLPEWIEYGKILKIVKATAADSTLKDAAIRDVRAAYDKRADIDVIKSVTAQDIEVNKESGELVISFAYTKKVPLFYNVSLVFDFEGSSANK